MHKDLYLALKDVLIRHARVIRSHPISFCFLVMGFFHALLVFYPGSLSVDSRNQFHQALAGRYDDWHPPVMAWVWRQLLWFRKGPQPMLWFHLGMFWSGLYLVWHTLAKKHFWSRSLVPLVGLMPPVIAMVGVIWKDIGLGASALLIIGLCISEFKNKKLQLCFLAPVFLYACWVRHNGIGLIAPFILALPFQFGFFKEKFSKQLPLIRLGAGLGLIIAMFLLRSLFENTFLSARHSYVGTYLQLFDLASIEADTKLDLIPQAFKTPEYSKETIAHYLYDRDPSQLIYIKGAPFRVGLDDNQNRELAVIWIKSAITHLPNYLKYRWSQYKSLIGWGYGQCRANHYYMADDFGGGIAQMKSWREYLGERTTHWAGTTPLFSGWFYLSLCAIGLLLSLFLQGPYRFLAQLCFISTILYSATYFIGSVSCDFRYVWPTTLTSVMGVILLLTQSLKQRRPLVDKSGVNLK